MQINKGDKLLQLGNIVDVIESSETSFTYSYPNTGYAPKFTISKVVPKPLYHDGQVVAKKATSFAFRIDSHYHDGNGYVYTSTILGFLKFYKEENLRPLTEQEKQ